MSRPGRRWTPEHLADLRRDESNTIPEVSPDDLPERLPGLLLWDYWPITLPDGQPVEVAGRRWWAGLTAPDHIEPEDRHDVARIRVMTSDGQFGPWEVVGPMFEDGEALGSREWAGSTVWDPGAGLLHAFYTATGRRGEVSPTHEQRIVRCTADVEVVEGRPVLGARSQHHQMFTTDGQFYKNTAGLTGVPGHIDALRDPAYFADPVTGKRYVVFTASLPHAQSPFDGCVGIAEAVDGDLGDWRLLPPLLDAEGVNKELERPQVLFHDGAYLLFLTTHHWTFAPGVHGPEGLYGFRASSLDGPFEPLNGSGLVLGNPPDEPHQTYSWTVLPGLWIHPFADYPGLAGRDLAAEAEADPDFKRRMFGGCRAPFLRLELDGLSTRLVEHRIPVG